jgi:hypothetical protein
MEIEDLNGCNLISYCIQHYAWECLTEVVSFFGVQVLDKFDENAEATPGKLAQKIGFEKEYKEWLNCFNTEEEFDWRKIYTENEQKTAVMFHGKLYF